MAEQLVFTTTKDGLQVFLSYVLGVEAPANFIIHSYSNDVTISEDIVLGDLVENIDYSPVELSPVNWVIDYTTKGEALFNADILLPFTSDETSYGCYITNLAETELIGISKFASPLSLTSTDTLVIDSMLFTLDN